MTTFSIMELTRKLVGPDAEEAYVEVCVKASITPPDRSVGIMDFGYEDLEITDADGNEINVSAAEEDRLGECLLEAFIRGADDMSTFAPRRGPPSEFYD